MPDEKPVLLGINHVALEVGDIDEALAFYGRWFAFELRSRSDTAAFIEMGDQFLALSKTDAPHRDAHRHFGLVVDDREGLRARMEAAGVEFVSQKRFDFLDPWGNRVEIVPYADIRFLKSRETLARLGRPGLKKTDAARDELRSAGIEPPDDA